MRGAHAIAALATAITIAVALSPTTVSAQAVRPSGSLGAHLLVADGGDLGGSLLLDVWAAWDWLRIGGFVGAGAIPSERDSANRVLMPLGISAAAELIANEQLAFSIRLRAGLWGGATQAEKLTAGPFFGGGAYLGFLLGSGAVLNVGGDVWGVIGSEAWSDATGPDAAVSSSTWVIAPGVGLSWTPEEGG